ERLLTDGPFAETKEHLLGFYLLEAGSLDVALDWAAKMPIMHYGTVEVRPVKEGMRWQTALSDPNRRRAGARFPGRVDHRGGGAVPAARRPAGRRGRRGRGLRRRGHGVAARRGAAQPRRLADPHRLAEGGRPVAPRPAGGPARPGRRHPGEP